MLKPKNLSPRDTASASSKANHDLPILDDPHNRLSPVGSILSTINVVGFGSSFSNSQKEKEELLFSSLIIFCSKLLVFLLVYLFQEIFLLY